MRGVERLIMKYYDRKGGDDAEVVVVVVTIVPLVLQVVVVVAAPQYTPQRPPSLPLYRDGDADRKLHQKYLHVSRINMSEKLLASFSFTLSLCLSICLSLSLFVQ